jgi:hypothetical protein
MSGMPQGQSVLAWPELAEALIRLDDAGIALARARAATAAARGRLRDRRASEGQILKAYEGVVTKRLEAAKPPMITIEERIAVLLQVDEAAGDGLAYEAGWYRRLLQSESATMATG